MPVIAVDLGGTKLACALFDDEGKILARDTVPLERRTGNQVCRLILEKVKEMVSKADEMNSPAHAIGIGVPGIANATTGKVWAPNIPGWEDYPLRAELIDSLEPKKIAVKVDSDRACAILGEMWKGNARDCSEAIFISVGTGIGAGICTNGQVLRGAHDIAGAIGWMGLDRPFQEKYSSCGCFEYYASGEGMAKYAVELISSAKDRGSLLEMKSRELITAKDVFDAFESDDPIARKVIGNAIEVWGMVAANLVSLFNPSKIIFGGGIFGPAAKFIPEIYNEAKKWAQPVSIRQVQLEASALGNDAVLHGAAYLVLQD